MGKSSKILSLKSALSAMGLLSKSRLANSAIDFYSHGVIKGSLLTSALSSSYSLIAFPANLRVLKFSYLTRFLSSAPDKLLSFSSSYKQLVRRQET